jgi:DNA polymerase III sliding clamp (beta) subunit (PCNA family)
MLSINTNHLKALLHCTAVKDTRYYLNGSLIECCANGDVHLVSTNGHMMFVGIIPAPNVQWTDKPQQGPWSMIIPDATLKAAIKTKALSVTLSALSDGKYTLGDTVFAPIDGVFPNWRRVLPSSNDLAKRESISATYNPKYIMATHKALCDWDNRKYDSIPCAIHQSGNACGVIPGRNGDTVCVIMPIREDKTANYGQSYLTPSSYAGDAK